MMSESNQPRKDAPSAIVLSGQTLATDALRAPLRGPIRVSLTESVQASIEASRATVEGLLASGAAIYGVNTGFGKLAGVSVSAIDLAQLQVNLVRSHAAGVGDPLDGDVVRLVMLLKLASLARGASGVRLLVAETLAGLLEHDVLPVIPSQGSVGASGDLAPLAHMSLVLIGEGEAIVEGERMSGAAALAAVGLEPLQLEAKEGLALLNGTQVSTALALQALFQGEQTLGAALVAGALSIDAVKGSDVPFDARIHALRPHPGQVAVAAAIRRLMAGSEIRLSHLDCDHVQDPYSFRCQPQVLGAALDLMLNVERTLLIEANSVSDNPLVFSPDGGGPGEVLSGGNFHAEPVAFAADILALSLSEIGAISERRLSAMVDPALSELPAFLAKEPGLQSGYMIAQVTAAALASENKQMTHPASVDSLPTSANQEDHVSMATHAAFRLGRMNANLRRIVAIELMAAAEGIDLRRPLKSSEPLERAHAAIRERVAPRDEDRVFSGDIESVADLIASGSFDVLGESLLAEARG